MDAGKTRLAARQARRGFANSSSLSRTADVGQEHALATSGFQKRTILGSRRSVGWSVLLGRLSFYAPPVSAVILANIYRSGNPPFGSSWAKYRVLLHLA
jgi:hypothetical protein